VSTLAVIAIEW